METDIMMITCKDDSVEDPDIVVIHDKHKFTLHGYSMYEVLAEELNDVNQPLFQRVELRYKPVFKRHVMKLPREDLSETWRYPLITDLCHKIEEQYGVRVKGIFVNHYKDPTEYAPFHRDSFNGVGVFTISFGGARMFYTKHEKTEQQKQYLLEDGDLFYFNIAFDQRHKHAIPLLKQYQEPRISIVFFV